MRVHQLQDRAWAHYTEMQPKPRVVWWFHVSVARRYCRGWFPLQEPFAATTPFRSARNCRFTVTQRFPSSSTLSSGTTRLSPHRPGAACCLVTKHSTRASFRGIEWLRHHDRSVTDKWCHCRMTRMMCSGWNARMWVILRLSSKRSLLLTSPCELWWDLTFCVLYFWGYVSIRACMHVNNWK